MAPFCGWGSTASRLEPLRGGSLLFTTKFPDIPGTHFIDLGRMKGMICLFDFCKICLYALLLCLNMYMLSSDIKHANRQNYLK